MDSDGLELQTSCLPGASYYHLQTETIPLLVKSKASWTKSAPWLHQTPCQIRIWSELLVCSEACTSDAINSGHLGTLDKNACWYLRNILMHFQCRMYRQVPNLKNGGWKTWRISLKFNVVTGRLAEEHEYQNRKNDHRCSEFWQML